MTTDTTQNKKDTNFFSAKSDNPLEEENQQFLEEVGTLIFQSALMKYLATISEETALEFESFTNLNVGADDFMEILCKKYPDFEEILTEEMKAFRSELDTLPV